MGLKYKGPYDPTKDPNNVAFHKKGRSESIKVSDEAMDKNGKVNSKSPVESNNTWNIFLVGSLTELCLYVLSL